MGVDGNMFSEKTVIDVGPFYQSKNGLAPSLIKTLNVEASDLKEASWERRLDGHRSSIPIKGSRVAPIFSQQELSGLPRQVICYAVGNSRQVYEEATREMQTYG